MPLPRPRNGESESEFISRCISSISNEYQKKQAIAICYSQWDNRDKKKKK